MFYNSHPQNRLVQQNIICRDSLLFLSALHQTFITIWMRASVCSPNSSISRVKHLWNYNTQVVLKLPKQHGGASPQCECEQAHERVSHRWSACCCRTTPRSWRASSRTSTGTGSTGRPPWPMPGSAQPRHPGTGRETRTPVPPTSGASTPTPGPPLCHSRMKP